MFVSQKRLERRTFLKGVGVAIGLPMLEAACLIALVFAAKRLFVLPETNRLPKTQRPQGPRAISTSCP